MEELPQLVTDVLFWATWAVGVLTVLAQALDRVADELEEAAERTEVQWDNTLASGLRAFEQGLARVLRVLAAVIPRIQPKTPTVVIDLTAEEEEAIEPTGEVN